VFFAPRLGAETLERPLLDLLPEAGQIRREETFPAEKFAHGFATVLRLQINLELLLGAQITALLFRTRTRDCGGIATANVFSCFEPPGAGMVPVALRAPYTMPAPSTV